MQGTQRVYATCTVAGAIVAFLVWFAWNLPWQGLAIGIFVGLVLYERMTWRADREAIANRREWTDRKPDRVEEVPVFGLPPTN